MGETTPPVLGQAGPLREIPVGSWEDDGPADSPRPIDA